MKTVKYILDLLKLRFKIISLSLDIIIIKIEYIIIINKFIYKIWFFYEHNKLLGILFFFFETIWKEIKKDFQVFKINFKKFKLFHSDMQIIIFFIYWFLFFAGIIPFIYFLLFIYFLIKYSFKYIFLSFDVYIYNYYDYIYDENLNICLKLYVNLKRNIENIFSIINKIYNKIYKFLFKMERKKKILKYFLNLRLNLWNKYVDLAQKYIDKFDNFILIRFPELWYDFEMFLYNLIIKFYIYRARLIKKYRKKRRKFRKKKKFLYLFYRKKINKIIYEYKFIIYKIRYLYIDYILYKKYNIRKYYIMKLYLPILNILFTIKYNFLFYYKYFIYYKTKVKWYLIMIIHPWFWDYMYYLYIYILFYDVRAIAYYIFPVSPFFHVYFSILCFPEIPKMWKIGIRMKIKAILYEIKNGFIFKPPVYLYKLIVYIIYLIYKHIYVNIVILMKLPFSLIYFYFFNNKFLYNLITYIKDEGFFLYDERHYRFYTLKCWAWIDFVAWAYPTRLYYMWRNQDAYMFFSYKKYLIIYLTMKWRFTFYIDFIYSKFNCLIESFVLYNGWDDIIDLYHMDLYYYKFARLAIFNKYIYLYPVENMYVYHYYYFTVKPGNFTFLRHYADKDLPLFGAILFVDYIGPCEERFSTYVCPLYKKTTELHLLSGKNTEYYDTYFTEFIVLPKDYLIYPKSQFKHPVYVDDAV